MKKLGNVFLITCILLVTFAIPSYDAEAKTLGDLRKELTSLKNKKAAADNKKKKTQAEIATTNKKIDQAGKDISACEQGIVDAEEEINRLEEDITTKEGQIKDLMQFYQVADSENFYLNYVFGATSYTEFIYRYSVVEQLATRNNELIKEMEELKVQNEKKMVDLADRQKELDKLTADLQEVIGDQEEVLRDLVEETVDINDEIKAMAALIASYAKEGCKDNQELSECVNIPKDTAFAKPLKHGRTGSEFGYRNSPITGKWSFHTGLDIGGNNEGTAIYAPANGRVAAVLLATKKTCGGNKLFIHHSINGTYYTTGYLHVLTINVKVGDFVVKGQKIATVGGGAKTKKIESCSTGPHLHFAVAKGLYLEEAPRGYSSYSTYVKKVVNPRSLIYFPKKGVYW